MTTAVEDARRRPVLLTLLVVYVLFLATVLLFPRGELPSTSVSVLTELVHRLGADPVLVTSSRVEVISNVLIMVPLALLGRLVRRGYSWRDWTAVGFVISTGVELFQGLFLPDRSASALDVVANTTGVAVGAAIGSILRWYVVRRDSRSSRTAG